MLLYMLQGLEEKCTEADGGEVSWLEMGIKGGIKKPAAVEYE